MKCVLMSVQTNATQPMQLQSNYPEVEIKNKTKNVTLDVTVIWFHINVDIHCK